MTNNVKVERARSGLTQAALAEQAKVSRQTINALERGDYVPSAVLALKLAKVLDCPIQELFELEPNDWS